MSSLKYDMHGSDYVGVYATVTDRYALIGPGMPQNAKKVIEEVLGVRCIEVSVDGSDLLGIFARANSNGLLLTNIMEDREVNQLKASLPEIRIEKLDSQLNTIGNNILVNDKIALINSEYTPEEERKIGDVFGVEVVRTEIGGFRTLGANNILTNKGFVINNRSSEDEKDLIDRLCGFDSVRTTANMGSLFVGISIMANSRGAIAGESTTGFELNRVVEGLNID